MKNILRYLKVSKENIEEEVVVEETGPTSLTTGSVEQSAAVTAEAANSPEVRETEAEITRVIEEKIAGTIATDPVTGVVGEVPAAAPEVVAEVEPVIDAEVPAADGVVGEVPDEAIVDAPPTETVVEEEPVVPVEETTVVEETPLEETGDTPPVETVVEEPPVEETEVVEPVEDGLDNTVVGETETPEAEEEVIEETPAGETEVEETSTEETPVETGSEETASEETGDDEDEIELDIPDVDTEVKDEDIEEAEEEADAAEAADDVLDEEIIDTSKSVDDIDDEVVATEGYLATLQLGHKRKSYTSQTVGLAQAKLTQLAKALGDDAVVIPSLEDYTATNMSEYYVASIESFEGFLKKLRGKRDALLDRFASNMNEKMHLKAVDKRVESLNAMIDQQINRVKDLSMTEIHDVKLPGILRGKDGPVALLTEQVKWLGDVAGTFKADATFLKGLADLLKSAVAEGDAVKATSIVSRALKLPAPVKAYPATLFTKNPNFEAIYVKSDKKAVGGNTDDMKTLGARFIPSLEREVMFVGTGPEKFEAKKATVVKMLSLAKIIIGLSRGTSSAAGKNLIDSLGSVNEAKSARNQSDKKAGTTDDIQRSDKALSGLVDSFWSGCIISLNNYEAFQRHCCDLVHGVAKTVAKVK